MTCKLCGKPLTQIVVESFEDRHELICASCALAYNTCYTCRNAHSCEFETNPSPEPKIVQKTIKNGGMQVVTTIRNPVRVEKTCKTLCKCFLENSICGKEEGWCPNYSYILDTEGRNEQEKKTSKKDE